MHACFFPSRLGPVALKISCTIVGETYRDQTRKAHSFRSGKFRLPMQHVDIDSPIDVTAGVLRLTDTLSLQEGHPGVGRYHRPD
jgi:hypothetical protein